MPLTRLAQITTALGLFIIVMASLYFETDTSFLPSTASAPKQSLTTLTASAEPTSDTKSASTYNQTIITLNGNQLIADLATTAQQQMLGLSVKENMTENQAMLFVFSSEDRHAFWMKDMKFPIDIIWIDANETIVHIEHSLEPCDPSGICPTYSPDVNSLYVLETSAGYATNHNVTIGAKVIINGSQANLENEAQGPSYNQTAATSCKINHTA